MRLYVWEPFVRSHHHAKFGGHRHCGSGEEMLLVVEVKKITHTR